MEAVDANGQPHPNAEHQVSFTLKGPGTIAAVGSADMSSEEPYQGNQRKLFHGKALVVVRASRTAGASPLPPAARASKRPPFRSRRDYRAGKRRSGRWLSPA